jgi:NitT/TauT family transport system permease protein/taurine transport system permease protein
VVTGTAPGPPVVALSGWRHSSLRRTLTSLRIALLPFILLLAVWWVIKLAFGLGVSVLPSPAQAVTSAGSLIRTGVLVNYTTQSLLRLAIGGVIGIAIGVPLGLLLGSNRLVSVTFRPLLNTLQGLSGIAWLPLLNVWLGFGNTTILAVILYTVTFPVAFNTMVGVQTVPPVYGNALKTLGASRRYLFTHVWLPGALPSILLGARLGLAYGWRALIAAEMVLNAGGLGYLLFQSGNARNTAVIVFEMVLMGALWVFIERALLRPIERQTIARWGMEQR